MKIGLRIDVDTFNGTRAGVPNLLDTLARHRIKASFFFSVGPDNMGRHIWRLFRWDFLVKMLRTKATRLYGWDILLRGTFWPGPDISRVLAPHTERVFRDGHEIGLHAWDHHRWQSRVACMSVSDITHELGRGMSALSGLFGTSPCAFAAPGWRGTNAVLEAEQSFGFRYGSDCRGSHLFVPVIEGRRVETPQIPVTLPTYDELIGRNGICDENYNEYMLSLVQKGKLNVLTIHAEVEGKRCSGLFEEFITKALALGASFDTLGSLLPSDISAIPSGVITEGFLSGREGWVAIQAPG